MLRYVAQARDRGLGVIFITHNPHHAFPVGDHFVILNRGRLMGGWAKGEITRDELVLKMSGGAELEALAHELGASGDRMTGARRRLGIGVIGFGWLGHAHSRSMLRSRRCSRSGRSTRCSRMRRHRARRRDEALGSFGFAEASRTGGR